MKDAGYSDSYAKSSTHLKNTKSWNDLMEEHLSDVELARVHEELLNKQEILLRNNNKTKQVEIVKTGQPHSDTKHALDMGYKLKGRYEAEKHSHKFDGLTKEELIRIVIGGIKGKGAGN